MKTTYFPPITGIDPRPVEAPDMAAVHDHDERIEVLTEFANYFTAVQANPGGFRRNEPNYNTTQHLTLEAAERAAQVRYDSDSNKNKRPILIYAVMRYANDPLGAATPVSGYPQILHAAGHEARLAKRKAMRDKTPKHLRNMPNPEDLPQKERYFEGPRPVMSQEDVQRALSATTVIGKGGSKIAGNYRNKRR